MKKIRIGKDININWQIKIDGQSRELSAYNLSLFLHHDAVALRMPLDFETDGDTIISSVLGKDQKHTGFYRLTLWLNKGLANQSVLDNSNAFCLVPRTELEGGEDDTNLNTEILNLTGDLSTDPIKKIEAIESLIPTQVSPNTIDLDLKNKDGEVVLKLPFATARASGVVNPTIYDRLINSLPGRNLGTFATFEELDQAVLRYTDYKYGVFVTYGMVNDYSGSLCCLNLPAGEDLVVQYFFRVQNGKRTLFSRIAYCDPATGNYRTRGKQDIQNANI